MAIDQHLFILTPPGIIPRLSEDGWGFDNKLVYKISPEFIKRVLEKFLTPRESKIYDTLLFEKDGVSAHVYLTENGDVELISIRISLLKRVNDQKNIKKNLNDIKNISRTIKLISDDIHLEIFDTGKCKVVTKNNEISKSICESRAGVMYGFNG